VVCLDDPIAARLGAAHGAVTYGTADGADFQLLDLTADHGAVRFTVTHHGERLGQVRLPLRGVHMARNATAAIAMAHLLGAPFEAAAAALARFGGVARRFDFRGERDGITFVDDYAHLPAEIAAVLEGAATSGDGWSRIVAGHVRDPRVGRMEVLSPTYRDAFSGPTWPSSPTSTPPARRPGPASPASFVVNAVLDAHPWQRVARSCGAPTSWSSSPASWAGDVHLDGCGDVAALLRVLARLAERASGV
jgi:UDP-N-acetylmuramate--alanine ligase